MTGGFWKYLDGSKSKTTSRPDEFPVDPADGEVTDRDRRAVDEWSLGDHLGRHSAGEDSVSHASNARRIRDHRREDWAKSHSGHEIEVVTKVDWRVLEETRSRWCLKKKETNPWDHTDTENSHLPSWFTSVISSSSSVLYSSSSS